MFKVQQNLTSPCSLVLSPLQSSEKQLDLTLLPASACREDEQLARWPANLFHFQRIHLVNFFNK